MAIFNAYMVNGTELPYKDFVTGDVKGTRHDRKLQVHQMLQAECHQLTQKGFAVIIAGDINIARSSMDGHPNLRTFPSQHVTNRQDFERRFLAELEPDEERDSESSLEMFDTFRHLHPLREGYSYYTRSTDFGASCDRVDMVLASKDLQRACRAAGMHETVAERASSDHVPIYATFHF